MVTKKFVKRLVKMSLFQKKCMYCEEKIEKGNEKFAEVKVIGYVGTFKKPFCNDGHINQYKGEVKEMSKRKSGSCCG